jgi:hypothetical protein
MDDTTFVVSMAWNHPKWMSSLSWPRRILAVGIGVLAMFASDHPEGTPQIGPDPCSLRRSASSDGRTR